MRVYQKQSTKQFIPPRRTKKDGEKSGDRKGGNSLCFYWTEDAWRWVLVSVCKTMPLRRFYTPEEVAYHNSAKDCWVSINYKVFDLSELISKNRGPLTQPIIDVSQQSVSIELCLC